MNKTLYWAPRILGIVFALFISIFALDMFEEGVPFFKAFAGFLVHLIPSYFIIAALIIAWKRELLGGILFLALYIVFLLRFRHNLQTVVFLSPLILTGILFIADYLLKKITPPTPLLTKEGDENENIEHK